MGVTTNYGFPVLDSGDRDPVQRFAQILAAIDQLLLVNVKPTGATLQWGDVPGGKYIQVAGSLVTIVGGVDLGGGKAVNMVLDGGTAFPLSPTRGQPFYRTDTDVLYVYDGTWTPVGIVNAAAVDTAGAVMETDYGTTAGTILTRSGSSVAQVVPAATLTFPFINATGDLEYAPFAAKRDEGLAAGSLRVGAGADTSSILVQPATSPDRRILSVDASVSPEKLAWRTALDAVAGAMTAKGDILAGLGLNSATRIAKPADNRVLLADSAQASGWGSKAVGVAVGDLIEVVDVGSGVPGLPALDGSLLTSVGETGGQSITVTSIGATESPYSPVASDEVILIDATAGAVTVNLPSAAAARRLTVKRIVADVSANTVTISPNGGDKIEGQPSDMLSSAEVRVLVADGLVDWHLV